MARVIWQRSDGEETDIAVSESVVLGRDAAADLQVDARSVSRRHARIDLRDGRFYVSDLGSTNGTLVNGEEVTGEAPLESGDEILLGAERLRFESDESGKTRSALATEPLSRTLARESGERRGIVDAKLPEVLPRRVGKFHLLEKLGQGGMGAVYRARDLDSKREVAVKLIRQQIGRKESFLQFFHHREAVLAREIDHDNVITVYEHGVEDEQHFISMEYVRGLSLYQLLKRRQKLEPVDVLEILRQVACGLAAAHRQGVVHSDIKPANILIVEGGVALRDDDCDDPADLDSPADGLGILEFESEGSKTEVEIAIEGADPGLAAEIRRRVGGPMKEVLVDPPYFPRPSEMRFLEHYVGRMESGHGFFIVVEGEAGTGKSRLISEFLLRQKAEADVAKRRYLDLDCSRIEGIPDLFARFRPDVTKARNTKRDMVEALKKRFAEVEEPTVLRVMELAKATPLVCDLLVHIASLMDDKPILVVASVDQAEIRANESLEVLFEMLEQVLKELYLRPLTEYQIQRYLDELFRGGSVGNALAPDLFRLSGGNFARMLDLMRSFFERDILKVDPSSGNVNYRPNMRELELEEGKNLYEKYRLYGKVEQRILAAAGFIGERFFFDTLSRLQDLDETSLYFVVRQLLADGFFTEEDRTWYGFTNVAFQRYMAERVPLPERPHLHRKLSRLLQTVPVPESPELYQLRARHFCGCREHAKAVQCLLEGTHLARNAYKTDLARDLYQEVLRIYRELSSRTGPRKEVTSVLKEWFRRDGNWYEILGDIAAEDARATVKIADFGISFRTADEERGYAVGKRPALGTPRYLAPERGRGERGGPLSDIFSLGVIAHEMIVGAPPFPGLKGGDVVRAYREQPVRVPARAIKGYPDGFDKLLESLLAMDSSRRWDAERIVREVVKLQFDLRMDPSGRRGGAVAK